MPPPLEPRIFFRVVILCVDSHTMEATFSDLIHANDWLSQNDHEGAVWSVYKCEELLASNAELWVRHD